LVKDIIDILIIEETKLDETFPDGQFILEGFMPPIRKDRNRFGGGIMIFIRENIPAKVLENDLVTDIECVSVELNFQNNKWLLIGTYRPPSQCSKSYYLKLSKIIDNYSNSYENVLLAGDFNEEITDVNTKSFLETHNLRNLVKDYTCYKSITNPSCIDLFLTNKSLCFKNTTVLDTGLSDFHRMIFTSFRFKYTYSAPKIINYRSFKNFDKNVFQKELREQLKI